MATTMFNRLSKSFTEQTTTNGAGGAGGADEIDDFNDDDADPTAKQTTTTSTKSWDTYVARFLPLERNENLTPEEMELEKTCNLTNNESWKSLPPTIRLNILRAYETERDRVRVTSTSATEIMSWRNKYNVANMLTSGPLPGSDRYFNDWPTRITTVDSSGDKYGHPILFDQITSMDFDRLMTMDEDTFYRYRTQAVESLYFVKQEMSTKNNFRVSKHIYILDLKGLSGKHLSKKVQDKLKPVFSMSSNIFPEILWSMWIINAPLSARGAWSVIRNFVDPVVRSKIRMFGPTQAKWHKAMELVGIPVASLPIEFGGQARSESLREVLLRSRFCLSAEPTIMNEVQAFFRVHDPTNVDEAGKLLAMYDNRGDLLKAIQDKYVFPICPHLIQNTFGPGPMGMIIKGRVLPHSTSVMAKAIVEVVGWAPPGPDKSVGQAQSMGTISFGDIIIAVGDINVLGMTEIEVKQKLIEAPRPVMVTFSRFVHG